VILPFNDLLSEVSILTIASAAPTGSGEFYQ